MNPLTNAILTVGKSTMRRAPNEKPKTGEVAVGVRGVGRVLLSGPLADEYTRTFNKAVAAGEKAPVDKNPPFAKAYGDIRRFNAKVRGLFLDAEKRLAT
jgi:hypothetical protein